MAIVSRRALVLGTVAAAAGAGPSAATEHAATPSLVSFKRKFDALWAEQVALFAREERALALYEAEAAMPIGKRHFGRPRTLPKPSSGRVVQPPHFAIKLAVWNIAVRDGDRDGSITDDDAEQNGWMEVTPIRLLKDAAALLGLPRFG
jgi:hypothetical protein